MKTFEIPEFYKSPIISKIKELHKIQDPRKKDKSPFVLDFKSVSFLIARHFGFCYGVENAVEISFKAINENPGKRIYLLSQMIHNPQVNADLTAHGLQFLQDTNGNQLIPFDELTSDDIVIIPAFGTTLTIEKILKEKNIDIVKYNTTCPFVERVWSKSEKIGSDNYTIIIHGKYDHEETRATFSRSDKHNKAVVIKDMKEAQSLVEYIKEIKNQAEFDLQFKNKASEGFDIIKDFKKVGVINQTTMLASETQAIADYIKQSMISLYGEQDIKNHFADTRDTLCYATNENQEATLGLLKSEADMAIVVGGYNSSNTSHIVELLEQKFPTYFICNADEIKSKDEIHHFDYHHKQHKITRDYLPRDINPKIIITSGASCPDALLEQVLQKLLSLYPNSISIQKQLEKLNQIQ